jgi:hypothetical protein
MIFVTTNAATPVYLPAVSILRCDKRLMNASQCYLNQSFSIQCLFNKRCFHS